MTEENKLVSIPDEMIIQKIYFIRNEKVMLDKDLAELYNVETKQLKRAVRRNISRFPKDFMFELTNEEFDNWRSQFDTSSWGGTRYNPMVFTEHGVLMLSSGRINKKTRKPTAQKTNWLQKTKRKIIHTNPTQNKIQFFAEKAKSPCTLFRQPIPG